MSSETQQWNFRRVAALVFVAIAALMVVLGLTLFNQRLDGSGYLLYWLLCGVGTMLAMIFAFWDLRSIRKQIREQQRELLTEAFKNVQSDAKSAKSEAKP